MCVCVVVFFLFLLLFFFFKFIFRVYEGLNERAEGSGVQNEQLNKEMMSRENLVLKT